MRRIGSCERSWLRGRALAVALTGGLTLLLGAAGVAPARATFPGGNGRIYFAEMSHGSEQIFTMRPNGTGRRQLTHMRRGAADPAISPDGSRVAFDSSGGIWVMDANGAWPERLTTNRTDYVPSWSPDGSWIAYEQVRPTPRIWVMDADGAHKHPITPRADQALDPDWSPEGTEIAFVVLHFPGHVSIFTVRPDGSHVRRVPIVFSPDSIDGAYGPSWSPDGTRFAFYAQPLRDGKPTCPPGPTFVFCEDIYTVPVTGGVPTRVTRNRLDDWLPKWSPDGRKIAFLRDGSVGGCPLKRCRYDVYTVNADGSGAVDLTNTPANDVLGSWAPA